MACAWYERPRQQIGYPVRIELSAIPGGRLVTNKVGLPSETPFNELTGIFCLDGLGERCQSMSNGGAGAGN